MRPVTKVPQSVQIVWRERFRGLLFSSYRLLSFNLIPKAKEKCRKKKENKGRVFQADTTACVLP